MRSGNAARESINKEPNEIILAIFRDVGLTLAEARKEQNLTIKQVANIIHIQQRYLIGLEEGQLSDLPGRVYILGFIRTYARLLNLDGEELIRRVSALPNLPNYHRGQPIPMQAEEEPNFTVLMASGILVFLIAISGYLFLKPATKAPLPIINETIDAGSKIPSSTTLEPALDSFEEDAPPQTLDGLPDKALLPVQSNSIPLNDPASTVAPVKPIAKEQSPHASLRSGKIILKASEPCWVELRDEAGHVLFMKVMKKGEEYGVPEKPGLVLNTGNAGGLDIFVGESKLPSFGAHGDVKRGIRLETLLNQGIG